jgi:hypothetical protein
MWRSVRTAFVWLMAVALPLQGLAAATMLNCGPAHHRMAALMASQPSSPEVAAHDHSAHAHHMAVAPDASSDESAADGAAAPSQWDQAAKLKCSACAACCSAAALPPAIVTFPSIRQAAVFEPVPSDSVAHFQTGGLDRPPRIHLV